MGGVVVGQRKLESCLVYAQFHTHMNLKIMLAKTEQCFWAAIDTSIKHVSTNAALYMHFVPSLCEESMHSLGLNICISFK